MNVLVSLYYLVRKVWFSVFPRKVGERGWAPAPSTTSLPPVGALPPAPITWAAPRLSWGMLGNDKYGDCVFAAICHSIMAVGHFLKRTYVFGYNQVVNAYLAWDHGNDSGVVIDGLLFTWEQDETSNTPLAPFGIGGPFVKLDPTNVEELKSAIATFGWVMVGSQLQQAQEDQFSAGQRWDYVPGSKVVGGHAVCLLGYDKAGVGPFIVSWGKGFRATWNWVTKTCPEAYTGVLPPHLASLKYVEPLAKLDEYCSTLPHV